MTSPIVEPATAGYQGSAAHLAAEFALLDERLRRVGGQPPPARQPGGQIRPAQQVQQQAHAG